MDVNNFEVGEGGDYALQERNFFKGHISCEPEDHFVEMVPGQVPTKAYRTRRAFAAA